MGSGSSGAQVKGESYTNTTRLRWRLFSLNDVQNINLTRISDSTGDAILSVIKFYNGDFYYQAFNDTEFGELYLLSQENINWLDNCYFWINYWMTNSISIDYSSVQYKAWMAKEKLIKAINDKGWNVPIDSDEFYGLWMHFTRVEVHYAEATQLVAQMVQTAVIIGATIYQTVVTAKSIGMLVNQKRAISATQYSTMSGYTSQIESRLGSSITERTTTTAELRNSTLGLEKAPYKPGTPVIGFKPTQTTQYVRVYTDGVTNPAGKWIMRYSDIQGLTPAQIKSKFALPYTPTHYCYVNVPSGTQIYAGIANEVLEWGAGNGVQFELAQNIPSSSFGSGIKF